MEYVIKTNDGEVTVGSSSPKLAKQATEALVGQTTERQGREAVAKELDGRAAGLEREAGKQAAPASETRKYLLEKARTARTHAAQIRAGEGKWSK